MATKSYKYKPTGQKIQTAKMLAGPELRNTITQLCDKDGVACSTFCNRTGDDEFRATKSEILETLKRASKSDISDTLKRASIPTFPTP